MHRPNYCDNSFLVTRSRRIIIRSRRITRIREHTHKKNCLNLGIAWKGGGGVPGLPKLIGALFMDIGNCLIFLYRSTIKVLLGYCV